MTAGVICTFETVLTVVGMVVMKGIGCPGIVICVVIGVIIGVVICVNVGIVSVEGIIVWNGTVIPIPTGPVIPKSGAPGGVTKNCSSSSSKISLPVGLPKASRSIPTKTPATLGPKNPALLKAP